MPFWGIFQNKALFISTFNPMLSKKNILFLTLFLSCTFQILRGQNLVVNPSFEISRDTHSLIPPGEYHISWALGWSTPSRAQASLYSSIPTIATTNRAMNRWRFMAKEGNNVVGITTYGTVMGEEHRELREYMQGSLTKPLTVGKKYYLSYWVHFHCEGTNNLGVVFLTKPLYTDSVYRLKLRPHINSNDIIDYAINNQWAFVRDSFIAREAYSNFIIGNFHSNAETKTQTNKLHYHKAYLDNVSIEEASDLKMPTRTFDFNESDLANNTTINNNKTDKTSTAATNNTDKNKATNPITTTPNVIKGDVLILNKVLFKFNSSDLDPTSFAQIDMLALLLKKEVNMKILVKGHTSSEGSDEYNNKLSESRAKSVVNYLISKGIEKSRLSYKGYGKTSPLESNDSESGREKNRRVEFEVTE